MKIYKNHNTKYVISRLISIIKEAIRTRNSSLLLHNYLSIKQYKRFSKGKYISNITSYFSHNFEEINYKEISPRYKIEFTTEEEEFIKKILKPSDSEFRKTRIGKEIFSCTFKNVKFFGISGGISYKNKVITESVLSKRRCRVTNTVDSIFLKHRKMKGLYTSIMHLNWAKGNSIWHWIYECLPRLYTILQMKEKKIFFIINKDIAKYQLEHLKLILDDRFQLITIGMNEVWKLEKYFFSPFVIRSSTGYMPSKYIDFIRETFVNGYGINPTNKKHRVYISRAKTSRRRLKNEEEFFELIKKYNFKRVFPELLSYKEQVEIFYNAEIIILTPGSAMANMIFSKNAKLFFIYAPFLIVNNVFSLCKGLGIEHKWMIGYDQEKYNADFRVDIAIAEKKIQELINTSNNK